ncbi:MAG TPA: phosphotransferase [Nocardioides sp.]|uniref:phosphotransferase enzyme family protein n=1 Tax=Nocardioides sp. TaxID=35761 RepID=UPI002F3F1703
MEAQKVADAFGLGRATSLSEPVARGEVGEIRRLETERGSYAVKQAFEPLTTEEVADLEAAGAFHRACWDAGIPTSEPMPAAHGGVVAEVDDEHVLAYSWVELDQPDTDLDPAAVGALVAQLHDVRHPMAGPMDAPVHEWFEAPIGEREWKGVLKASRAAGAPYADGLAELLPALIEVEWILTPMRRLQVCHLDLWADNLRRTRDRGLCILDFENAGPADPSRELAMVVFEFGQGDQLRQRRLYDAYREEGGPGRVTERGDASMAVAQLHHIGHRHLTMWLGARDPEARARSLAGVEEFLGGPLLLPDVDRLVAAVNG